MIRRGNRRAADVADDGYTPGARPPPAELDTFAVCLGTDLAFSRNSSAVVGARPRPGGVVEVIRWIEWRASPKLPLVPSHVFKGIVDFARDLGAVRVWGDGHARESALEVFRPAELTYLRAPAVPAVAYTEVQRLLQEGLIRGLDCPGLVHGARREDEANGLLRAQLERVRMHREQGGHTRIELPQTKDGRHCDVAAAAVLAIWAAAKHAPAGYAAPIGARLPR